MNKVIEINKENFWEDFDKATNTNKEYFKVKKLVEKYSKLEDNIENKAGINSIKVGDSVSYNGRVGKVTKDFENGMMFVNFENGGMGRFAVKDLQKMNPTADEVTETATENAVEQNVNGTNEAVQEEVTETVKEQGWKYIN